MDAGCNIDVLRTIRRPAASWRLELRAVGWLFGADTVTRVVGQLAVVLTARLLAVNQYGALSVGFAVFSIALVFADGGVGDAAVQKLTRRQAGATIFCVEVQTLRILLGAPLFLAGLGLAAFAQQPVLASSGVMLAAVPLANIINGKSLYFRIQEKFPRAAIWTALLLLCQWLGALGGTLIHRTAMSAVLGVLALYASSAVLVIRRDGLRFSGRASWPKWLHEGRPFVVTASAVALYSRGDRIVVAVVVGSAAAGEYTAAYSLIMLVAIAGAAVHSAVLPRLLHESRHGSTTRWRRRAILIIGASFPAAAVVGLVAPVLIRVLYGNKYSGAAPVLEVLSPLVVLYLLNPFLSSCLIAAGRQTSLARIAVGNLLVSIVAYPVLTLAMGEVGTALASVLVELLGLSVTLRLLRGEERRLVLSVRG